MWFQMIENFEVFPGKKKENDKMGTVYMSVIMKYKYII